MHVTFYRCVPVKAACLIHVDTLFIYTFLLKGINALERTSAGVVREQSFTVFHYNPVMLIPGVNNITNTDPRPETHVKDKMQYYTPEHTHTHTDYHDGKMYIY